MRSHTLTRKMTTLHIFLDGELAVGWWQPGLRRQSPWRVQTSLKNSVYINMHIFIIHQCFALLAAGPRPHGSMSSLPCSFVWHGCRCFEREIKLVSVAAKTYMVVGVARTKNNTDFLRACVRRTLFMGNWSICKLRTMTGKFSSLSTLMITEKRLANRSACGCFL